MHTVKQASELWCPMARTARRERERPEDLYPGIGQGDTFIVGGCNTDALGGTRVPASCRCVADACAMWRWGEFKDEIVDDVVPNTAFGPGGKSVIKKKISVPVAGYCGLAGKPGVLP